MPVPLKTQLWRVGWAVLPAADSPVGICFRLGHRPGARATPTYDIINRVSGKPYHSFVRVSIRGTQVLCAR